MKNIMKMRCGWREASGEGSEEKDIILDKEIAISRKEKYVCHKNQDTENNYHYFPEKRKSLVL